MGGALPTARAARVASYGRLRRRSGCAHRVCARVLAAAADGRAGGAREAYRYLAELPWAPHAIAANSELAWSQVEEKAVAVATVVAGDRAVVRMEFDADGDIARCLATGRPRLEDSRADGETQWGGDLSGYRFAAGVRVPTRAEVFWDLPSGRFVYWRGQVATVEPLAEDFTWRSR